ncbi:NUDIX domain-containing protein [Aurantibacillus circumpalustris]|uniref:NUDIX domain-containing protein n=1 Tax=Aurantibacillus circumpalustris TaxID=3036359 RepID=UPI00295AF192|nr:NUDIX domain-containing protein [Aurantibacillus circumpalustris]
MSSKFNVRVYGILIENNALLVSDEYIKKNKITKLPGGGLEFGEGIKDCLIREFQEELNLKIEVTEHFYTTDFFVTSSFDTNSQVISIYYIVEPLESLDFKVSSKSHDYEKKDGAQSLRWINLKELKETDFTLIIDRKVGEMLVKRFGG